VKLIIQPEHGDQPLVTAMGHAKKSLCVLIFRLDDNRLLRSLAKAIERGVGVRILMAYKNRGGNRHLRQLELEMLRMGAQVSRTAEDLVRYHGKMMIIDDRTLHLYGFNYTCLDLASRSFGIITKNHKLVQESLRLFNADTARQPYKSRLATLIVSPENSRERLTTFIEGAKRELLIYDPRVKDDAMLDLLQERAQAGVDVRIIGKVIGKHHHRRGLHVEPFPGRRLHVRSIIRDQSHAFLGSQSLDREGLDERREIGMIVNDKAIVREMSEVFLKDWAKTGHPRHGRQIVDVKGTETSPETANA
jgi:cardiolipin synthase A/B